MATNKKNLKPTNTRSGNTKAKGANFKKEEIISVSDKLLTTIQESNKKLVDVIHLLLKLKEDQDIYVVNVGDDNTKWSFIISDVEDPAKDIKFRVDYEFNPLELEVSIINTILISQLELIIKSSVQPSKVL